MRNGTVRAVALGGSRLLLTRSASVRESRVQEGLPNLTYARESSAAVISSRTSIRHIEPLPAPECTLGSWGNHRWPCVSDSFASTVRSPLTAGTRGIRIISMTPERSDMLTIRIHNETFALESNHRT